MFPCIKGSSIMQISSLCNMRLTSGPNYEISDVSKPESTAAETASERTQNFKLLFE